MPKTVHELLKDVFERANGETLTDEQLNAIEIPALKTSHIPDEVTDAVLGGLYNVNTATNDPVIAGKILGAKMGAIDAVLKPALIKHFGWTEQQYNEKRKAKTGNTLAMTIDFINGHGDSVNKAIESALKDHEGKEAEEIRAVLEAQYASKLDASVNTNKDLVAQLAESQTKIEQQAQQFAAEKTDFELTTWINSIIGGYTIKKKLLEPLVEGEAAAWSYVKPKTLQKLKTSYAWQKQEDGSFVPMNAEDPTMGVLDPKTKKPQGAKDIFQSTLAPYLATNDPPPNGGGGNRPNPGFLNTGGNGNPPQIKTGVNVGEAQRPTSWD